MLSQVQVSSPEPEPTPSQRPDPTGSHGLEGALLPCLLPLPPAARQEAPSDQAWTAAQWAFGHLLNGLQGWEVTEHWTWKGPQRSDDLTLPFSRFGGLLGVPFLTCRTTVGC